MSDSTKELFAAALSLPPAERAAFVVRSCAEDEARRRRVERLLAALEAAGGFLHEPEPDQDATDRVVVGDRFGAYELVALLGRGGFGSVWRARQRWPIEREVAVKVGPARGDTQGIGAVRAEQRALARLSHPGIARVYDAGQSDDGRAWIAMELVHGVPITAFCREHELTLAKRLSLFVEVCAAAQYVHTQGIVHRDLKPANVLISDRDGRARPVLIDFGIAHDDADELPDGSAPLVGTPEYMSPEQVAGDRARIDARSDVYALGVLLYELACGRRPFESDDGPFATLRLVDAIQRDAARPPSARGTVGVPPELDWITARAMAKDPGERYATALALAEDVQRLLRSEPVHAAPDGLLYRLRCFVRRRRYAVAAGLALFVSLVGGGVAAGVGWRATAAALAAARQQQQCAEAASRRAERALELLEHLWGIGEPDRLGREGYTVRELLADCARELPERAGSEPRVAVRVHRVLAKLQAAVGDLASACAQADAAVALARAEVDDEQLPDCLLQRAEIHHARCDADAGRADASEVVGLLADGPRHTLPQLATAHHLMASCALLGADVAAALSHAGEALGVRRRLGDVEGSSRSLCQLAAVLTMAGRHQEAKQRLDQALATVAPLGAEHPAVQAVRLQLAMTVPPSGEGSATEAGFRRALELRREVLGPRHAVTAWAEVELGWCLLGQGCHAEAETLLVRGCTTLQAAGMRQHVFLAEALQRLGELRRRQGRLVEAVGLLEDAVARFRQLRGMRPDALANSLGNLALVRWDLGAHDESVTRMTEAVGLAAADLPPDNAVTATLRTNLATLHARRGELATAAELLREALASSLRAGRPRDAEVQRERLQRALRELGREDEAASLTPEGR